MSDSTPQGQIDAANTYEALFVPALFGQWTAKVADAARIQPGQRVLDVACGTGILARESALRVGSMGHVAGIDASPEMVAKARQLAPAIEWREGFAESIPFADQCFDAVVSQFGLMFFTDRRQALREMFRVLVPGGRLAIAVWDGLDSMPAYASEAALLEHTAGRQAADALRAPFVLGNREELATLFTKAGISSVEITTHRGTAQFPSIRSMVEADLRGWLPVMGVVLSESLIANIIQQAEQTLSCYQTADRRVAFDVLARVITARKP